jgi:hypothetical protein
MAKYVKKLAILATLEAVVGTFVMPTSAQAIEVSDVVLTPIEGEEVSRNVVKPYFGASKKVLATRYRMVAFSVGLAGVAAAGDLAPYDSLLQACGATSTNTEDVSTVYTPRTDAIKSLSIYAVLDKMVYKLSGGRGNAVFTVNAKGVPVIRFEFTGAFVPVEDVGAMPAADYAAWQEVFPVNKTNTTLEIDSFAVVASSFELNFGNTVVKDDKINKDTTDITGRESTLSVTFENTSVAEKDWVSMVGELVEVALVHGPAGAAPNQVAIAAPQAQVGKPTYGEENGIQMITVPLTLIPTDAGNDEWEITV